MMTAATVNRCFMAPPLRPAFMFMDTLHPENVAIVSRRPGNVKRRGHEDGFTVFVS